MPTPVIVLFPILLAMVAVWFPMVIWVFSRLRTRHPEKYEQLGSPSLIWNNSMRNQWLFTKFMFSGQFHEFVDVALSRAIIFMRVWLIAYLVLFLTLLVTTSFAAKPR